MTGEDRLAALRQAFIEGLARALDRLPPDGTVYAIAVDPGDLYDRAFLYANTLEVLPDASAAMDHLALKWSIADWQYQGFAADALDPFNDRLAAMTGDPAAPGPAALDAHCLRMQAFYVEALSSPVVQNILSTRFAADRPLLGLLWTDQSDEDMVAFAEKLNPPDRAARFAEDLRRLRQLQQDELSALDL